MSSLPLRFTGVLPENGNIGVATLVGAVICSMVIGVDDAFLLSSGIASATGVGCTIGGEIGDVLDAAARLISFACAAGSS